MRQSDKSSLYALLESLPTGQLEEMLDKELHSTAPDDSAVRMLLEILRQRTPADSIEITPEIQSAWQDYQQKISQLETPQRKVPRILWLAASFLLAVAFLFSPLTQQAEADGLWERLARWTDDIFAFVSPHNGDGIQQEEYVFQTDNPGLQQVYDAVVELGITDPVVPMWLPEGYELVECQLKESPAQKYVHARFSKTNHELIIKVKLYSSDIIYTYQKSETPIDSIEKNGTTYNILKNKDIWTIAVSKENVESSIFVDCQEDILYKILESIYAMEENN